VTVEDAVLAGIWLALTLYAVLGGADFGAGIWEALTAGRLPRAERDLLYRAIGPVWEANHVWLIFVIILAFTSFPPAFAAASRALAILFVAALVGIVVRGAAFAYRSYGPTTKRSQAGWSAAFGLASTAAPAAMGAAAGAIASGRGADPSGGWAGPLPAVGALLAMAMCAYLAAVYLAREGAAAGAPDLMAAWRRRGVAAGVVAGTLALGGLFVASVDAPVLWDGLRSRALPLVAASGAGAFVSFAALWRHRFTLAAAASAVAVGAVIAGWGVAQHPAVLPPNFTIESSHAPRAVLVATLVSAAVGAAVLAPSLVYLLRVFKAMPRPTPED
jgi:cytochrome bd ubiquinol oxidase subunit II